MFAAARFAARFARYNRFPGGYLRPRGGWADSVIPNLDWANRPKWLSTRSLGIGVAAALPASGSMVKRKSKKVVVKRKGRRVGRKGRRVGRKGLTRARGRRIPVVSFNRVVGGRAFKRRRVGPSGPKGLFPDTHDQFPGDLQKASVHSGRKLSRSRLTSKLAYAASSAFILRYQGVTPYWNNMGYFSLSRPVAGVPPALNSSETMPLYLFNLTNLGVVSSTALGSGTLCPWQLQKQWLSADSQPNYNFVPPVAVGNAADGVATSGVYTTETSDTGYVQGATDLLEWVQMRLLCVGPPSRPIKWHVSIVQFRDDYFTPEFQGFPLTTAAWSSFTGTDQLARYQERVQLYDSLCEPLCGNPVIPPNYGRGHSGGMKVLWSTSFATQPKAGATVDQFTAGEERMLNIFKRFNRLQNYAWQEKGRAPLVVAGADQMGWAVNIHSTTNDVFADVHPRARVYLMVRSESPLGASGADSPTFDLVIRKKHVL